MGRKLILAGLKLTNLSAPVLPDIDAILPESGALLFLDPSHPYRQWPDGVPAHTQTVPNLAEKQAMALTGLSASQIVPAYVRSSTFETASRAERSTKGGFHVLTSRTAPLNMTTNETAMLEMTSGNPGLPLAQWVIANKAHSFYVAKWGRWTRPLAAGTYSGGWQHAELGTSNSLGVFFSRAAATGENVYAQTNRVGWEAVNHINNTAAPYFIDGAWSTGSHMNGHNWRPLRFARNQFGAGYEAVTPSDLLYGYYVEDLTVSGRTYAQVHDAVKAKYTLDVLTPGGRYYGDTWTDPATLD